MDILNIFKTDIVSIRMYILIILRNPYNILFPEKLKIHGQDLADGTTQLVMVPFGNFIKKYISKSSKCHELLIFLL